MILTLQHSPVTPFLLLPFAPMIPAMWVPWPCIVIPGALAVDHIPAPAVVDDAVVVVVLAVGRVLGVLPQIALEIGMVALHAGVEHRHLRAARPLVPRGGRVDVVVVLLLDRVLLDDTRVVGALLDADRRVVLDALHPIAVAQAGAERLEADPAPAADRGRADEAQALPELPPARWTICLRRALLVSRRNWTSSRVTGGAAPCGRASGSLRKSHRGGGRRGQAGGQDGDGLASETRRARHVHAAQRTGAMRRSHALRIIPDAAVAGTLSRHEASAHVQTHPDPFGGHEALCES